MNTRNVAGHSFAIAALGCASLAFGQRIDQVRPPITNTSRVLISPQVIEALQPDISIAFVGVKGNEQSLVRQQGNSVRISWALKNDAIKKGVFQVSSKPFDLKVDWRRQPNLLASGDLGFAARRGRNSRPGLVTLPTFTVNFSDTGVLTQFSNVSGNLFLSEVAKPIVTRGSSGGVQLITYQKPKPLDKVYIRVVGIDSNGVALTGASNVLVVNLMTPLALKPIGAIKLPVPGIVTPYKFKSAHQTQNEFYRYIIATRNEAGYVAGRKYYLTQSSGGSDFFSDFVDSVAGLIEEFMAIANNLANPLVSAYYEVRSDIENEVYKALSAAIKGLDQSAVVPIMASFDEMFVSVGLPPTLVNLDSYLKDTAYFVRQEETMFQMMYSEMMSVPGILISDAKAEARAQAKAMMASYVKKVNDVYNRELFRPDPDYMYRPASFVAIVRNGENIKTRKVTLDVSDSNGYFEPMSVKVPPMEPGEEIAIPIFLTPTQDPDRWLKLTIPPLPVPTFGPERFYPGPDSGWKGSNGKEPTEAQKKYGESVKAWTKALVEKEAIRKSWETIYTFGKGSNGGSLAAKFVLSIEGKTLKVFEQNLGG